MFTHRDHLSLDLDPLRIAFNLIVWILSFKEASSCRNDKHLARLSCSTVLVKYHAFECTRLKAMAQFITSLKLGVDRCIACRKASSTVITLVFLHPTSVGQECVAAPVHREVNQLHISLIWRGWTAVRAYWFAWCAHWAPMPGSRITATCETIASWLLFIASVPTSSIWTSFVTV